jgi:hypothetical protein
MLRMSVGSSDAAKSVTGNLKAEVPNLHDLKFQKLFLQQHASPTSS